MSFAAQRCMSRPTKPGACRTIQATPVSKSWRMARWRSAGSNRRMVVSTRRTTVTRSITSSPGTATFYRGNEAGPFEEDRLGLLGEEQVPVASGDVLFVPAGAIHCFDAVSPDFAVWAIFYGPEGGEAP